MTSLGPYTLLRRLGAGGMGEVWSARRTGLGGAAKLVAIKTLLPDKSRDPAARRMFLDEARLSMLMSNSNIVQVFEAEEAHDGTCYLVMEYVEGIDLARLLDLLNAKGELLSHSIIAYIVGELLKALAYAHDLEIDGTLRTIVHRDVSPHNVMLSVSGEVKLMDFGIARLASEETSGTFIKGKIRYMPPEQLAGESKAPTIDLFAVGAILHELLDGKRFRGGVLDETRLLAICFKGEIPKLTCPPERVPIEFERLRTALLEADVGRRIPSARAAYRMLIQWPGDRDAKFELEEIIRQITNTTSSPNVTSDPPTLIHTEVLTGPTEVLPADTALTPLETVGERSQEGSIATQVIRQQKLEQTAFSRWLAVVFVCGGLAVAVAIVGAKLSWWMDGEVQPVLTAQQAEPLSETDPPPASLQAHGEPRQSDHETPESTGLNSEKAEAKPETAEPKPETIEPKPETAEPKPETAEAKPETAEPKPETAEPKPETAEPKQSSKTPVTITVGGVWAQVAIAGKEFTFDRLAGTSAISTKLKPGSYAISFRIDPQAPWKALGKVSIPEKGPVTLEIKGGKAIIGSNGRTP